MARAFLRIQPVETNRDKEHFIHVLWDIYRDDPFWVPPLLMERREHLDPNRNPFFRHGRARLWIARRGARTVGRISAQVNEASLDFHQDATGHFGFIEAEDDAETFAALLEAAEGWLHEQGMRRILGPMSFSINEETGLLVDGFETRPSLMMGHARRYYGPRLAEQGYVKAKDLIAYHFDVAGNTLPPAAQKMVSRLKDDPRIAIRPLNRRRYTEDIRAVLDIFNDAWSGNWGFVPWSEAEIDKLGRDLKLLLREDFVCIIEYGGVPAAFGVNLLNLNEAIADLDGRLLPWGWIKLLYRLAAGRVRTARMPLMGVRRAYHNTPLGAAFAYAVIGAILEAHRKRGTRTVELSWILEDNNAMRRMIESCGGTPCKTYRLYEKSLL